MADDPRTGVYILQCPICRTKFRWDAPTGPLCTGPLQDVHDHDPEPMRVIDWEPVKPMVTLQ